MVPSLAERVRTELDRPPPDLGPWNRLWLVGTGPFHDAAELGTFPFAGSGRSAAVVAGEGHARLGELLGPQDACVLVGGDAQLAAYARRVGAGAGATVTELDVAVDAEDGPTVRFVLAATRVLQLCRSLEAPGVTPADLGGLADSITDAGAEPTEVAAGLEEGRVLVIGSGPAAVTARHVAVRLRTRSPSLAVEGLDAQDVPGVAAGLLAPGTTVVALDTGRGEEAPVDRMARMARAEGATVVEVPEPSTLEPVARQLPLAWRLGAGPVSRSRAAG